MSKKQLKKEIEEWLESAEETALIELTKISDDKIEMTIGENEEKFTITCPKEYPSSKDKFFIFSEEDTLSDWQQKLNEYADKPNLKIEQLLSKGAEIYLSMNGEAEDSNELEEDEDLGLDTAPPEKTAKKEKSKEEAAIDEKEFLPIGSATATMRLIKDLKNIAKSNPKELGFSAAPTVDPKSGLENLYHWHVKLFGFDPHSDLAKDMEKFKQKSGQDFVLLELRFSSEYPFKPPFVRVLRPRFAFRTGHVTLGGSICMELLTNSGWNSTNDIESILIQIRAEMTGGGARLDAGMSGNYEYSEQEAWEAFYRAASTHGWDVKGLGREMFPKVNN